MYMLKKPRLSKIWPGLQYCGCTDMECFPFNKTFWKFWDGDNETLGKNYWILKKWTIQLESLGGKSYKMENLSKENPKISVHLKRFNLLFSRNSGKCCSFRYLKFPEIFQTEMFHWLEQVHDGLMVNIQRTLNLRPLSKGWDYK